MTVKQADLHVVSITSRFLILVPTLSSNMPVVILFAGSKAYNVGNGVQPHHERGLSIIIDQQHSLKALAIIGNHRQTKAGSTSIPFAHLLY